MIPAALLRALLCIALAATLGGCASMPFFGSPDAKRRQRGRRAGGGRAVPVRGRRARAARQAARDLSRSGALSQGPARRCGDRRRTRSPRRRGTGAGPGAARDRGLFQRHRDERAQHRHQRHAAREAEGHAGSAHAGARRRARGERRARRGCAGRRRSRPLASWWPCGGSGRCGPASPSARRPGTTRRTRHSRSCAPTAIRRRPGSAPRRRSTRRPTRRTSTSWSTAVRCSASAPSRVEGIERYDADAVRRLATFAPGTPYREKLLLDYQERLVKAGLFQGASVEIDPDPANAGAAPVTVKVKELTLQQATLGVGYSANTGPRVTLDHYHRRDLRHALDRAQQVRGRPRPEIVRHRIHVVSARWLLPQPRRSERREPALGRGGPHLVDGPHRPGRRTPAASNACTTSRPCTPGSKMPSSRPAAMP